MATATNSLSPSFVIMPSLFFSVKASELLESLKAAESLRKAADRTGLLGASVFFSSTGTGLLVEAFHCYGMGALSTWLPSGHARDGFSLPLLPLLSFLKATKGKGEVAYKDGKLSASASGASLSLPAGPSLFDHPDCNEKWRKESHCLPAILSRQLDDSAEGFPLFPFLSAVPFCSDDAARLLLCGAGFRNGAFYGTDGFCLRKAPASLPAFPKAGRFPAEAWLPSWLSPVVEAFTKPTQRASILAFFFPAHKGAQALRFCAPSGSIVALRFPEAPGAFPDCDQLFPDRLPFSFTGSTKAFVDALASIAEALKASDGMPYVELSFDGPIGEARLSATIQRNVGTKQKPELEDVGQQEASLTVRSLEAPKDPRFGDGFFDLPESQQTMANDKFQHESRILLNAKFLQKTLKSFLSEGEMFRLSWKDSRSPIVLSAFVPESKAIVMPVQKRR